MAKKKTTKKKTTRTSSKKVARKTVKKTSNKGTSSKGKKSGGKGLLIGAVVVILLIVVVLSFSKGGGNKVDPAQVDEFAKCITEKGAVMYGAFWCPHCARTKKKFGNAFQHVKYVECDPRGEDEQAELCIELGIESYDTWIFSDGTRVVGEPTFAELSEGTGCPVPEGAE